MLYFGGVMILLGAFVIATKVIDMLFKDAFKWLKQVTKK